MNNHDNNKIFFEYYVKNILQHFNLINEVTKDESPDWISFDKTIGLEITKADETEDFSGYVEKYGHNHGKISKFNKNYVKRGGRVFKKTDPIVKILNLQSSPYHEDYIHIIPGYNNNFDFTNRMIKNKLDKLNDKYKEFPKYYLGIISTIHIFDHDLNIELDELNRIQSTYIKIFSRIYIICFNKLLIFDLDNYSYNAIDLTKELLDCIALKTKEEIGNK